jgi:hypothetical protein
MSRAPRDSSLVDRLVADLEPVRAVRLGAVYGWALVLEFVVIAVVAAVTGMGRAHLAQMADPATLAVVVVLGLGSCLAALTAARLSLPGRVVSDPLRGLLLATPLLLAAAIVLVAPWGGGWRGFLGELAAGMPCMAHLVLLALPLWTVLLLFLRRLAPLDPGPIGVFTGLSAMLQGAILLQLTCPAHDAWHLALTHYVPILVFGLAMSGIAGVILRR